MMARCFGTTPQNFRQTILPLVPASCQKKDGRRLLVFGRGCLEAWYANRLRKEIDRDPMEGDGESPSIERWRHARADLAELELEAKKGNLVRREEIHKGLVELAARLRQFGETLQRDFGADAHRLLEELLDDYQREVDRLSGHDSNSQHAPD